MKGYFFKLERKNFPYEILYLIFEHLQDSADIVSAMCVNKTWQTIIADIKPSLLERHIRQFIYHIADKYELSSLSKTYLTTLEKTTYRCLQPIALQLKEHIQSFNSIIFNKRTNLVIYSVFALAFTPFLGHYINELYEFSSFSSERKKNEMTKLLTYLVSESKIEKPEIDRTECFSQITFNQVETISWYNMKTTTKMMFFSTLDEVNIYLIKKAQKTPLDQSPAGSRKPYNV